MERIIVVTAFSAVCMVSLAQKETDTTSVLRGNHQLNEVVVISHSAKERIDNVQMGQEKINLGLISKTPSLFGENYIFKAFQLLPGIKAESDASSGFQVRGGTSAQNQVLLDNVSIYQAGHLMGLFSTFNDDALYNVSLYKGLIPAQYGGATSAVLSVDTRSGDMNTYHYGASIGLLSAKAFAEGPIVKDKASFLITARRSYMDMFLAASKDYKDCVLNFYDINAKIDWRLDYRNRLSLAFFNGRDKLGITDLSAVNWHNTSLAFRWLHHFSDRLSSNTTLYYSDFSNYLYSDFTGTAYDQTGYIRHYGINYTFQWMMADALRWNIGFQSDYAKLCSAEWTIGNTTERETADGWENSVWANGVWTPFHSLSISAGMRVNLFTPAGSKSYFLAEPRISANWHLDNWQSIKAGYSYTTQNIHAVAGNTTTWPFDRYIMTNESIKPEKAQQVSLGYAAQTNGGTYDFSLEGYYKTVENDYDYRDGKNFRSDIMMENIILGGSSHAYGIEFGLHKNTGRLTGWISYTLSWVKNKIDGINNGDWYTANNDRRHDITIVGMYQLSNKWDISASWKYNTGQALSAPSAKYTMMGKNCYYYAERNGYRAPDYHRLDLSLNRTSVGKKYTTQWSFGLYNAYGRKNPFLISFNDDDTKPSGVKVVKTSLFSVVPSVSFSIKY